METLINKIRACRTLEDLIALQGELGPSATEIEEAEYRMNKIRLGRTLCEWDVLYPGKNLEQVRISWENLLREQATYERKYNL